MADESETSLSYVDNHFDRLSVTSEESSSKGLEQETSKYDEDFIRKWGFPLKDLYRLALRFYKEKDGKAVHFSYKEKLKLVAFTKQVTVGKFNPETSPPLGVLDVIGHDRRLAWQALGDMNQEDAMAGFVDFLDARCHLFRPFAEAHKADLENRKRIQEEEAERRRAEEAERRAEEEERRRWEEERNRQENQKKRIQEALNQQTYHQFRAYAQQQFPSDLEQQELLVGQLQEEHYHQYMEQLMSSVREAREGSRLGALTNGDTNQQSSDEETGGSAVIPIASMWTRKDVKEFKESIRKEGGDAVIKVGHGETVTVRVPTNSEGTCLFWEFATDHYDIGFGVYFEWSKSPTSQVSVHVSESEDDDDYPNDDDDDDEDDHEGMGDVERGGKGEDRPPLSIIVPVYRRECQDEVYAGSHAYPGHGVYLLKFDNSYSLWRSKTLYYRVYYTR